MPTSTPTGIPGVETKHVDEMVRKIDGLSQMRGFRTALAAFFDSIVSSLADGESPINVSNNTGGNLAKGDLVYITSYDASNKLPEIGLADGDVIYKLAQFVLLDDIADGSTGRAAGQAIITEIDSSSWATDTILYLSDVGTTGNTLTSTPPTDAEDARQRVAVVRIQHATQGVIEFFPAVTALQMVGTTQIQDDAITTAKIVDDALSADAAGRAKMADDFFNAATALAKFAAGSMDNTFTDDAFAADAFAADAASRAKFSDDIWTADKLANSLLERSFTMPVLGDWAIDGDGARTNGAGLVGATAELTQAGATLAQCFDFANTEFNQLSLTSAGTDYTSNYQLFTDTKNDGDYAAFGGAVPFPEIAFDMSATVQTYTGDGVKWQYSQGAGVWADLTVYDGTDATAQDGLRAFGRDGAVAWHPPADWATDTLNGQLGYWVRSIIVTNANVGTVGLTNSVQHDLVTPARAQKAPANGSVTGVLIADAATTLHTANDVIFTLMNYTSGASTQVTFAQDIQTEQVTLGTALAVTAGDELGLVVTQEDGTNEPTGVILALTYTAA